MSSVRITKGYLALTGNCSIHNLFKWKAAAVLVTFHIFYTGKPIKPRDERERERDRGRGRRKKNQALVLTLIANDTNG